MCPCRENRKTQNCMYGYILFLAILSYDLSREIYQMHNAVKNKDFHAYPVKKVGVYKSECP